MLGERVKPRKGYGKVITKLELLHGRARDAQRRRGRRMTRHEVGRRWCPPPPPFTIIYHHTYLSIDGVRYSFVVQLQSNNIARREVHGHFHKMKMPNDYLII